MSSQASSPLGLPQPVAVAIGLAGAVAGGLDRTARSVVSPLWRLARQLPGAAAPLDEAAEALADNGTAIAQQTVALAEGLTRQLLRAALPIVFEELAAAEKLDLTALVLKHVDFDAIITRLDLPRLVHQVIGQLDLTKLVIEQVDVDAIAASLDIDGIIARVDLDAAVHQVDLLGLATEIIDGVNLPEIIRESTGALSTDAVRGVRTRGVDADAAVSGFVDRLLGRDHPNEDA